MDHKENGLEKYVDIRYLNMENSIFEKTAGGFIKLTVPPDEKYSRVNLIRAFPFSCEDNFISVRDTDGKEIGIIKNLTDFSQSTIELFEEEMRRRYFSPVIMKIHSVKEEYGYTYWDIATDSGPLKITLNSGQQSIVSLEDNSVIIADVDGNRYVIPDTGALDAKSFKKLEMFI